MTSTCAGGCRPKATRLASPPPRSCGITIVHRSRPMAPAGRIRRGRDLARRASSRKIRPRQHDLARPHLQPAPVRALALGPAHQYRHLGDGGLPSVYRTDVNAAQFLPHSPLWLAISIWRSRRWAALLSTFTTPPRCCSRPEQSGGARRLSAAHLRVRSDLSPLPRTTSGGAARRHRLLIAGLHFIQPLARFHGRVRGMMSPPLSSSPNG